MKSLKGRPFQVRPRRNLALEHRGADRFAYVVHVSLDGPHADLGQLCAALVLRESASSALTGRGHPVRRAQHVGRNSFPLSNSTPTSAHPAPMPRLCPWPPAGGLTSAAAFCMRGLYVPSPLRWLFSRFQLVIIIVSLIFYVAGLRRPCFSLSPLRPIF